MCVCVCVCILKIILVPETVSLWMSEKFPLKESGLGTGPSPSQLQGLRERVAGGLAQAGGRTGGDRQTGQARLREGARSPETAPAMSARGVVQGATNLELATRG